MLSNSYMTEPILRKVFCNNANKTKVVSIPNELAEKYGIEIGTNVVIEDGETFIKIKKLVIA
jgi:uncharacterized membrane protein (UPF0127 family)